MALDATVYCDCYERGTTRTPPPQPELVFLDSSGAIYLKCDDPQADENRFYDWLANACEHGPWGQLVSHRLGNIALIGFLRRLLEAWPEHFPILLQKVLYNGTHCGDHLSLAETEALAQEMNLLKNVQGANESGDQLIRDFENQMLELILAARSVGKPIAF